MTFFQSSYAGDITGCLIEQKYGCNYDYINRLFKKATGKTMLAYLNELRISKARQLLSDGTSQMCIRDRGHVQILNFLFKRYYFVFKATTGLFDASGCGKPASPQDYHAVYPFRFLFTGKHFPGKQLPPV